MLIELNAPFSAIVVCLGNDNHCKAHFGMPETKGRDYLTQDDERVALIAMAEARGWDLEHSLCPTCALVRHRIELNDAQEMFNTTRKGKEKDRLEIEIAKHEAYIEKHRPKHEQVDDPNQPPLPLDGGPADPDGAVIDELSGKKPPPGEDV